MRIKFWGTRGSTPTPDPRNARYGGNTPCIEVRLANNTLLILDCGSGLRSLGKSLRAEFGARRIEAYIFLTHFHWDHIQGIPFFFPFYQPENVFLFHSTLRDGAGLKSTIEGQMANPYFPVNMNIMGSTRHFFQLDEAPVEIRTAVLTSRPLNHPQGCVGYRVEADGGVFVLATDTEPGSPPHDRSVRELAQNADVLVYDAQYTPEQLAGEKKGWGHSSWREGVQIARDCGVKHLILFHHDPDSDDQYLDQLGTLVQEEFPQALVASEGLEIDLPSREMRNVRLPHTGERRTERRYQIELPVRVGWRKESGKLQRAEGLTRDISKSGIYLVVPSELDPHAPLEVELTIPADVLRGESLSLRLHAHPVHRENLDGVDSDSPPRVGVGAQVKAAAAATAAATKGRSGKKS